MSSFEDTFIRNLEDSGLRDKLELEKAHTRAVSLIQHDAVRLGDFEDFYDVDTITTDREYVDEMTKKFESSSDENSAELKKYADALHDRSITCIDCNSEM